MLCAEDIGANKKETAPASWRCQSSCGEKDKNWISRCYVWLINVRKKNKAWMERKTKTKMENNRDGGLPQENSQGKCISEYDTGVEN